MNKENSGFDIDQLIMFWSDISLIVLQVAMEQQGDTESIQYFNVRNQAQEVMTHLKNVGVQRDELLQYVAAFQKTHSNFMMQKLHEMTPENYIPATLVATAVQNHIGKKIELETFKDVVQKAFFYLSNKA
jgi:hypothetical protein